jgi:crotonobetainyl-CoA:carnitine CoA-transferase CaiB-like acyl-CoA transferase
MDRFAELVARFTKSELREEFVKRDIRAAIIDDIQDVYENLQLRHKNFWVDIEHRNLGESIPYPGDLFYSNEPRTCIRRRAPGIGEHNQEIYQHEFGLSTEEMESLREQGVI